MDLANGQQQAPTRHNARMDHHAQAHRLKARHTCQSRPSTLCFTQRSHRHMGWCPPQTRTWAEMMRRGLCSELAWRSCG